MRVRFKSEVLPDRVYVGELLAFEFDQDHGLPLVKLKIDNYVRKAILEDEKFEVSYVIYTELSGVVEEISE